MKIVYALGEFPVCFDKSIMLCGPTPRSSSVKSWRPEALKILEILGYDGVVFVPEMVSLDKYGDNTSAIFYDWDRQIKWEYEAMKRSDCVLFWIPRDLKTMPAFTTNDEWGYLKKSGKVVFGAPEDAPKTKYQKYYANLFNVPTSTTLVETIKNAMEMVKNGAMRHDGECKVPLMIWNLNSFQSWYLMQKSNDNKLKDAELLWNFKVGPNKDIIFAYVLWVNIWIEDEKRNKSNEFVFFRTDISSVVLYKKAENFRNTEIVLVKEFRSPVRNGSGMVIENPGGSSFGSILKASEVAAEEVFEETGLRIEPSRFKFHCSKQIAATLSSHVCSLYSVELTNEEMQEVKKAVKEYKIFGNLEDSERTYLLTTTVDELLRRNYVLVDWSMLGMILKVIGEQND